MWKNWFYYSKSERRVIVLLSVVLTITIVLVSIEATSGDTFKLDDKSLALADSLSHKIRESKKRFVRDSSYNSRAVKSHVSEKREKRKVGTFHETAGYKPLYIKQEKFSEGTLVDLNIADTTVLKKIPGIGSVISRNIVHYRERLGGFYDISQLLEVRYVDSTLLKWFKLESGIFRKLKVNYDNIDVLKSHPYMNYYKAKAIIEYRNRRGNLKNISQLSFLKEFNSKDIEKLKKYLDFSIIHN